MAYRTYRTYRAGHMVDGKKNPRDRVTGPGVRTTLQGACVMPDLTEPVFLSDPLSLPEPVPTRGCTVCAALGRQRDEARRIRDYGAVSDCNVEMRRHPHRAGS